MHTIPGAQDQPILVMTPSAHQRAVAPRLRFNHRGGGTSCGLHKGLGRRQQAVTPEEFPSKRYRVAATETPNV